MEVAETECKIYRSLLGPILDNSNKVQLKIDLLNANQTPKDHFENVQCNTCKTVEKKK